MGVVGPLEVRPNELAQGRMAFVSFMGKRPLMCTISYLKIFCYPSICFTQVVILPGQGTPIDNIVCITLPWHWTGGFVLTVTDFAALFHSATACYYAKKCFFYVWHCSVGHFDCVLIANK